MAGVTTGELVDRAERLCQEDVPVESAVDELIRLSNGRQFELSAGYAAAVRVGGGKVTPAAKLLELAGYEREGALSRATRDPRRLPGRVVAAYFRALGWGAHWLVLAMALLIVIVVRQGESDSWWVLMGVLVLTLAHAAMICSSTHGVQRRGIRRGSGTCRGRCLGWRGQARARR